MEKTEIKTLQQDERGSIFDCGPVQVIFWNQGSKSKRHSHPHPETIYVLRGSLKVMHSGKKETLLAFEQTTVPSNTEVSIEALDNCIVIETRGK